MKRRLMRSDHGRVDFFPTLFSLPTLLTAQLVESQVKSDSFPLTGFGPEDKRLTPLSVRTSTHDSTCKCN